MNKKGSHQNRGEGEEGGEGDIEDRDKYKKTIDPKAKRKKQAIMDRTRVYARCSERYGFFTGKGASEGI